MLACLLFGFADAVTIQLQGVPVSITLFRVFLIVIGLLLLWFVVYQVALLVKQLGTLKRPLIVLIAGGISVAVGLAPVLMLTLRLTRGIGQIEIPVQFIQMIPYVVTIVVLAGFIGQSRAPRAIGVPYEKER